jgi:hypothetical protein
LANAEGFSIYANEDDCDGTNFYSEEASEIVKGIVKALEK